MTRRIPIFATLVVAAAIATMVWLGFWQLDRLEQKEALLAEYQSASQFPEVVDYAEDVMVDGPGYFRRVRIQCGSVTADSPVSGRNANDQAGWAHQVRCEFPYRMRGMAEADVVIGWSDRPTIVAWSGGEVTGRLVPGNSPVHRIVADPPLAGLEANATPDPATIPNNHFAYAVQWFLFAITALVIYILALRRRAR